MKAYIYGPPVNRMSMPLLAKAVLDMLLGLAQAKGKYYCFPSQKKMLKLLWDWQRVKMSRSTLCRNLKWLKQHNFTDPTRRHRRVKEETGFGRDRHMLPCSTLYKFGRRTFSYLRSLGKGVLEYFSHFRMPHWEKKRMVEGKSRFLGAMRKFLVGQQLDVGTVRAVFGLRA